MNNMDRLIDCTLAIDGLPLKVDQIVPEDVVLDDANNPPELWFYIGARNRK